MSKGEMQGMQPGSILALKALPSRLEQAFRQWQVLLEERTGLLVGDRRHAFLQASLAARLREISEGDYTAYYWQLTASPRGAMDVIFCQNLLSYFRRWRRCNILNCLVERLVPGGLLMVSVGEVAGWEHPELQPVADERVLAFTRNRT